MSFSLGNVVATVILGVALGVVVLGVQVFRSQSQQNFVPSSNGPPLRLCPICYQQFQTGQTSQKLPCGHEFHKECISSVLGKQVRPSCPSCRATFSPGGAAC